MTADEGDGFGADPAPDNVIPFPAMRPNAKLSEAWAAGIVSINRDRVSRHELLSPLQIVPSLIKARSMPTMPWPAAWPELARRARTYPGDCVGLVGAIGGGKTSKAIQTALAVSGAGIPVLWAPLELGREQLISRILANMNGVHAMAVRDTWTEDRIRHQLAAVDDMWHFVDRYDDTDQQIAAIRDAIDVVIKIYRVRPLVVVDHIGQLITESNDARLAMLRVGRRFEKMALDTMSWIMLLAQGSRSGQALLTGKVEVESAADAIGAAAESSIMEAVCANVIVTRLFKVDDAAELDGTDLVAKARHTGQEGQIGVRFSKAGGVWSELGYLPATPGATKAKNEKDKKDRHRTGPAPTMQETRAELNSMAASDADAMCRAFLLEAITRHGALGMERGPMSAVRGSGRGTKLSSALQELERSGAIEKTASGRWRCVPR